nr:MAG TPA: hypothetical protein [Bacteriophage sp.]
MSPHIFQCLVLFYIGYFHLHLICKHCLLHQ